MMEGVFGQQQKKSDLPEPGPDVGATVRDITRRLRVIEERYTSIRKNIQVNEQNMLKENKKNATDMKAISSEMMELKKSIRGFGDELKQIIKELKQCVKKEEVLVLERYIALWQPMEYVTHKEMDRRIKDILRKELETAGSEAEIGKKAAKPEAGRVSEAKGL